MRKDIFGEKFKDFTWDNVIFNDETIFSDFRKIRKKWVKKEKCIILQKQERKT